MIDLADSYSASWDRASENAAPRGRGDGASPIVTARLAWALLWRVSVVGTVTLGVLSALVDVVLVLGVAGVVLATRRTRPLAWTLVAGCAAGLAHDERAALAALSWALVAAWRAR